MLDGYDILKPTACVAKPDWIELRKHLREFMLEGNAIPAEKDKHGGPEDIDFTCEDSILQGVQAASLFRCQGTPFRSTMVNFVDICP